MKKILITGGAGFIGSNFTRLALNSDYSVVVFDKLTYAGNLSTLDDISSHPNFTFIKGDISDRERVDALFSKHNFNYVINFAAESHVDRSISDPDVFIKSNIMGVSPLRSLSESQHTEISSSIHG